METTDRILYEMQSKIMGTIAESLREMARRMDAGEAPMQSGPNALRAAADGLAVAFNMGTPRPSSVPMETKENGFFS